MIHDIYFWCWSSFEIKYKSIWWFSAWLFSMPPGLVGSNEISLSNYCLLKFLIWQAIPYINEAIQRGESSKCVFQSHFTHFSNLQYFFYNILFAMYNAEINWNNTIIEDVSDFRLWNDPNVLVDPSFSLFADSFVFDPLGVTLSIALSPGLSPSSEKQNIYSKILGKWHTHRGFHCW